MKVGGTETVPKDNALTAPTEYLGLSRYARSDAVQIGVQFARVLLVCVVSTQRASIGSLESGSLAVWDMKMVE